MKRNVDARARHEFARALCEIPGFGSYRPALRFEAHEDVLLVPNIRERRNFYIARNKHRRRIAEAKRRETQHVGDSLIRDLAEIDLRVDLECRFEVGRGQPPGCMRAKTLAALLHAIASQRNSRGLSMTAEL